MKKVLLLVAHQGFQQKEYIEAKQALEYAGMIVVTGSDNGGYAVGKDGETVAAINVVLGAVKASDYEGIFLIGGPGTLTHLDNQETQRIFKEASSENIPYGAICIAPRILAKGGVLEGKRATGWNDDKNLESIFSQYNVQFEDKPVVVDGNVVTATGPDAAASFGEAIVRILS